MLPFIVLIFFILSKNKSTQILIVFFYAKILLFNLQNLQ